MAKKRMFSLSVLETDAFMDMPLSSQTLYFHLCMRADDDGFIGNPKRITENIGATIDDLKLLIAKRFVLIFEDGVIVIKHWRMHNAIRSDRYTSTNFTDDLALLSIKDNGAYTFNSDGNQMATTCHPNGNHLSPKWQPNAANGCQTVATGKVRLGKDRLDKSIYRIVPPSENQGDNQPSQPNTSTRKNFIPPTVEEVDSYCKERGNNVDAQNFVDFYEAKGWMIGKNKMKDWKAAVRTWENKDKERTNKTQNQIDDLMRMKFDD